MRALTVAGAAAAAGVGFVIYTWGGVGAAASLLLFFVSASAWTKWGARIAPSRRRAAGDAAGRGALQVFVNGAVPALAALGLSVWPAPWWSVAFAGALAAVTADTWATEIGAFSRRPPVLVTTGEPVPPGRSGAVSFLGTMGGVSGAVMLAASTAALFMHWPFGAGAGAEFVAAANGDAGRLGPLAAFVVAVTAGGILGMVADSFLGATVQASFHCSTCLVHTEAPTHRCGTKTDHVGGVRFWTNDTVNLAASFTGAVVAAALFALVTVHPR